MKRIIIICEGQTEQSFCQNVLQPYFNTKNIWLETPTIKKSGGGIVNWNSLKKQIITTLIQNPNIIVTTFIDYYGILERHNFPNWLESEKILDKNVRIKSLENAILLDINPNLQHRFFPYIQLHEFECLLFCNPNVFTNNFDENEFLDFDYLLETFNSYSNPEMINNGDETSPSKRLSRILKNKYNKVTFGSLLAEEIGLKLIMEKCPRFNEWVLKIENVGL
ncbi:MAG: DUF4276 family protein [Cytophagales bacterium]|nr:MAG: DUF4276 family protein [Cytophagales bacterium]